MPAQLKEVRSRIASVASTQKITKAMMGFKSFESAEATVAGIELSRMLKKGQMENAEHTPVWKQVRKKFTGGKGKLRQFE